MGSNRQLLLQGGVAGHLSYPHEVLSPEELLTFIEKVFQGELVGTEKVDGINIFVGFDNNKQVSFARNKTEEPFINVIEKFSETHPQYSAFLAATEAIKKAIVALTDEELEAFTLLRDNKSNNFINAEILYGEVPNIIPYSKIKNFIVFHNFKGRKETGYGDPIIDSEIDQNKLLNKFASRLGLVEVETDVISYFGEPGNVSKQAEKKTSKWDFKGPINISFTDIKTQLDKLLQELKSDEAYVALHNAIEGKVTLDDEQKREIMKRFVELSGRKILSVVKSALTDPDINIPTGHPGIEGIVFRAKTDDLNDHLVKITGDFAHLNQEMWEYLRETIPTISKKFTGTVLGEVFGVKNLLTLTDASFRKYISESDNKLSIARKFLVDRSNKYKRLQHLLDQPDINVYNALTNYTNSAIKDLATVFEFVMNNPKKFKQKLDDVKRAILISAYQFQKLNELLSQEDTVTEMFVKMLHSLFPIKFARRKDGLVEVLSVLESDLSKSVDKKRVGIFIGKFDPPHVGHMQLIKEMLDENEKILVFISAVKKFLPVQAKIKILQRFLKETGMANKVSVNQMQTGFMPDLIKQNMTEDEIQNSLFTIYIGTDRVSQYERQFRNTGKDGVAYWKFEQPTIRTIERDTHTVNDDEFDNLLSMTRIAIKTISSTLLRKLVRHGTEDAKRLFINSQPTHDRNLALYIWNQLKKEV